MAKMGYCPSGRLFEAASCGTLILSDDWPGMDQFFARGSEILIVQNASDIIAALGLSDYERTHIANAARERALEDHTGRNRASEFERIIAEIM